MTKNKTTRKATHKGQCQVCGCTQKLPSGVLSLHGYTTRWGFFSGVCHGAGHLPFEQSKDLIEGAITRAEAQAAGIRVRQEELRQPVPAGTTKAWINVYFPARQRGEHSHYRFVELECYHKDAEATGYTGNFHVETKSIGGFDCGGECNRRVGGYRDTLEEAITKANAMYAASMDKTLAEIATYIAWQRKRIKDWAPKPLLPLDGKEGK